jgi:alpha-glucoside transport system permease protein
MQLPTEPANTEKIGIFRWLTIILGRIIISLFVLILTFILLWQGFVFLRNSNAPKVIIAVVAVIWGGGGIALLYFVLNWLVEQLNPTWVQRLQPFVFVGPGIAIVTYYLAIPTIRTLIASLLNRDGSSFVGLRNYATVFTDPAMLVTFRNNLLWIAFGASLTVVFGLIIAALADRSRFEAIAKSIIFMPMAISLVGAGIIWKFIYTVRPVNAPQIGLLNAVVVALGGQPEAWIALLQPWNNLFLIVIVIWLQTGYAMVLFSAAIKGVPAEILEAARVDGANEFDVFFRITIPLILGTIIAVTTTVVIFTLKIFDVVIVMTGGQYGTEVIATQFYHQYFVFRNFGLGSTLAIILLIAVIPIMIYNLRGFSKREVFS